MHHSASRGLSGGEGEEGLGVPGAESTPAVGDDVWEEGDSARGGGETQSGAACAARIRKQPRPGPGPAGAASPGGPPAAADPSPRSCASARVPKPGSASPAKGSSAFPWKPPSLQPRGGTDPARGIPPARGMQERCLEQSLSKPAHTHTRLRWGLSPPAPRAKVWHSLSKQLLCTRPRAAGETRLKPSTTSSGPSPESPGQIPAPADAPQAPSHRRCEQGPSKEPHPSI